GVMRSPAGILLLQFDAGRIAATPEGWARAYRQLQAGTMPPVGAPRPDRATYDAVLASLDQTLGGDATALAAAGSSEIAARLATLLWNGTPDASLLEDARQNRLTEQATLERQIKRMLADDRAKAFVSKFFLPWLQIDKLSNSDPDKKFFSDYD